MAGDFAGSGSDDPGAWVPACLGVFSGHCEQVPVRGLVSSTDQPLSSHVVARQLHPPPASVMTVSVPDAAAREDSRDQQKQDALESKKAERQRYQLRWLPHPLPG